MRFFFDTPLVARALGALLLSGGFTRAIQLDLSDTASIKSVASTLAHGAMDYYHGNESGQTTGLLPNPYYWWEAGALFMTMIEYWFNTGDSTYNSVVAQGLLAQVGPDNGYMPPNQTTTEGNDDQVFWAFACMDAAEMNFPDPPAKSPQWLELAQAVFNLQADRWDTGTCGGGLRWQIYTFNSGYNYKNSISNGGFFQLAARLARYTGNDTYAQWAEKSWDWWSQSPLLNTEGSWSVYDGTSTINNCSDASLLQWTYNYGTFLMGAAYMYNYTNGDPTWGSRVEGLLNGTNIFYAPQYGNSTILVEVACEPIKTCNNDQPSFKSYLARWMASTTQLAPFTTSFVMTKLAASAQGAAAQCSGGTDGVTCGSKWYQSSWDGTYGVGQQMSALSVIQANLISKVPPPVTATTGGTSRGNPSAGSQGTRPPENAIYTEKITAGDRAGAGILTFLLLATLLWTMYWIMFDGGDFEYSHILGDLKELFRSSWR